MGGAAKRSASIRVLVADDHPLVCSGLGRLLAAEPDIELVGCAASGRDAVALAAELRPDVVLMDLAMHDLDGVESTRAIVVECPETTVLVLTSLADAARIERALDAGAAGSVLKDVEPDELVSRVRTAAARVTA